MKLAVFDPLPTINDYVLLRFFNPLIQFCHQTGIPVKRIQEPIPESGWTMLCNAHHLTPGLVKHFDDNRCPIAAISCNDSVYLTEGIRPFFHHIPLLFTISGVQKVNWSKKSVMNPDMTVGTEDVQFLPDEEWSRYEHMRDAGRLLPLPYVPWDRLEEVPIPEHKTPKILFRGGNHFWRFVAYLHALKAGVAHPASGFLTADYFREDMNPQFRYCKACRSDRKDGGGRMLAIYGQKQCECQLSLEDLAEPLKWNNRTPRSFFALTKWFETVHGSVDTPAVEQALNFQRQSAEHHLRAIADAALFCECKWHFSIPFPQRAWEAASVRTVNYAPARAMEQEYFPTWNANEHYAVYSDDFSDIGHWVDQERLDRIADNAKAQYEEWIKPGEYVTNTNLLRHITERIKECAS